MTPRAAFAASAPVFAILALAPAPAPADDASAGATADVAGSWSLETSTFFDICTMSGELDLHQTDDPALLQGSLLARQTCGDQEFEARETVAAHRRGAELVLDSTVVTVEPKPPQLFFNYGPDNFALAIVDGSLMVGGLKSTQTDGGMVADARFLRRKEPIS